MGEAKKNLSFFRRINFFFFAVKKKIKASKIFFFFFFGGAQKKMGGVKKKILGGGGVQYNFFLWRAVQKIANGALNETVPNGANILTDSWTWQLYD